MCATTQPDAEQPATEVTEEGLVEWLRAKISDLLGVEPFQIDVDAPLIEYGLESRQALILMGDVEDLLDRKLPATIAWDYPTIASLAKYIADASAAAPKGSARGE